MTAFGKKLIFILSVAVKYASYAAQFASVTIITENLTENEISLYFMYAAINFSASAVADLGYIRYSFRYYRLGIDTGKIISKTLTVVLTNSFIISLLFTVPAFIAGYTQIFYVMAGSLFIQLLNISRNFAISAQSYILTTIIETLFAFFYLSAIALPYLISAPISFNYTIKALFFSQLASFSASLVLTGLFWTTIKSINSAPKINLHRLKSLKNTYKRALPVGIELIVSIFWHQSLVIISGFSSSVGVTASLGFFNRIFNVVKGTISVGINFQMSAFYERKNLKKSYTNSVYGATITALVTSAIIFISEYILQKYGSTTQSKTMQYIAEITTHWLSLGLLFGVFYLNQNTSFILLGMNARAQRLNSSACGFASFLFFCGVAKYVFTLTFSTYVWCFIASFFVAHTVMLSALRSISRQEA